MFLAAFASLRHPDSKAFYDRKELAHHSSTTEAVPIATSPDRRLTKT